MTICYVANYSKTYVMHEIANELVERDPSLKIVWIVVNRKLNEFLKARYDESKVLYISKSYLELHGQPTGDYQVNELIYGDRVWKHDMHRGSRYLTNIQQPVITFLKDHHVNCVFG